MTKEEEATVNWYQATTGREKSGKYVVRLSFEENSEPDRMLRDFQKAAHIQFSQRERRLLGNTELRTQYVAFMQEYVHQLRGDRAETLKAAPHNTSEATA